MFPTKRVLGKGLASLIPTSPEPLKLQPEASSGVRMIPVAAIRPNPQQPRKSFDEKALTELADSVRATGILQPLLVRERSDGFELIAGERRLRAARLAGLAEVPALVRSDTEGAALLEYALIENLQREDLNPVEEAEGYRELIDRYAITQEEVAGKVGKDRATVANALRLLRLAPQVREWVRDGALSASHGRAIAGLISHVDQIRLAERVIKEGLSVRAVEELTRAVEPIRRASRGKKNLAVSPQLGYMQDQLREALGTMVRIIPAKSGGRILISYSGDDQLGAIYKMIARQEVQ